MFVLGATTSDPECGIALMRDGEIVSEKIFTGSRICLEEIIPVIENALAEQSAGLADIDLYALDIGPGGLTGIKIGLVAIRTLAQVFGKKVVPVSPLHAVACAAPDDAETILVATICSAKEVFTAVFERHPGRSVPARICEDRFDTPESAAARFAEYAGRNELCLTGSAAGRVSPVMMAQNPGIDLQLASPQNRPPRARRICALASECAAVEWMFLQANYLVPTQAERMKISKAGA